MIKFEDFKKLDIKIGTVVSAERVSETDKLLKLVFDFGGEKRQIIAGIAEVYPEPSILIGKQMPVILNLEPSTFRGERSEGMMLAADVDGKPILLVPEEEVPAGSKIR